MPRVSILLTCYNHIKYLPVAWQGVESQTFRDWEVIAIDDGSTDGSREWLEQLKSQDGVQVIFTESNLGTYGALNRALAEARGEFIAILNDDDLWAPTKLEKQIALMEARPEVGLVHTEGWFVDGEGNERKDSPLGFAFPRFETGDLVGALIYENKVIASAALARRECFERLGGFNEAYFGSGDWEMWMRIAEEWAVGCVPEPLTFYRVHGANASHKLERIWKDDQMLREWFATREQLWRDRKCGWRTAFTEPGVLARAMAHNSAALGTVRTLNGDPAGGRKAYADSIRRFPGRIKSYVRWVATFLPKPWFRRLL